MHITIVGTGYVGLVTGVCFANTGNVVTCLDLDKQKIETLNSGKSPIYEPGLDSLIKSNTESGRLKFRSNKKEAYQNAQIIFICVGTPSSAGGGANLKYILSAADDVGRAIENCTTNSNSAKIVVVKSTVPVGTNSKVKAQIAKQTSKPFCMASNPEFLKEGDAVNDFIKPDRVIIGTEDEKTAKSLRNLYEPFVREDNPVIMMDIPSAEMVKYASNAMLATKISFINEIANLCEAYGSDVEHVRQGMCADKRIGSEFLHPGLGFGGSCFPKDVLACISMGESTNTKVNLLQAVHDVNQDQRKIFFNKILSYFGEQTLQDKKLAIWGLAFKPGTDDVREAPAIPLINELLKKGAKIAAHDPVASKAAQAKLNGAVEFAHSPYSAIDSADALIICTDWPQYMNPDFGDMKKRMNTPVIFDGRNLYHPSSLKQAGFNYYSVGRKVIKN